MMRTSIERLRVWLLVGAGLLVIVIAAFLGYAHMRAHRFLKDLPGRLGADITRESNGFTYSQSSKGRTIYTIHAAKMVQRKDGRTTLRDVGIVLYGQNQNRADRIYGSEFEYDQKAGVVRALGTVHLDLQAPAPTDARGRAEYAAGRDPAAAEPGDPAAHAHGDEQMVHVTTSGLVFVQELGVASTEQEIEFQYHGLTGRAKGANYNSDTGITVLESDVRVSGLRDGQPVLLTSAHAEMDRGKQQMSLLRARYVALSDTRGGRDSRKTLTAEQASVHLRADGSADRVLARGGVTLEQAGGVLKGQSADVVVGARDQPQSMHLFGGVTYAGADPRREVNARGGQGTAHFDQAGRLENAALFDSAEIHIRERASENLPWNDRRISGGKIDMRFATSEGRRQWMQVGTATGDARMLLVDESPRAGDAGVRETTTELRADSLSARMTSDGGTARLSHVVGEGHTTLRRTDATGGEDRSSGQMLDVSFGRGTASTAAGKTVAGVTSPMAGHVTVVSAVQSGGVTLTHTPGVRPGRPPANSPGAGIMKATAARATFAGEAQVLTLSGPAEVTEGDSLLRAQTVTLRRETGDTSAEGSVSASYRQPGSAEPVHVLSARLDFKHDSGQATFSGTRGAPARLWQGPSQVEAPVIEFNRTERTLAAGIDGQPDGRVRTVLVSGGNGTAKPSGAPVRQQVIRVSSQSLRYSDADRRADFSGGVVFQDAGGTVRAKEVTALLRPAGAGAGGSAGQKQAGFMSGSVDRVTAGGAVVVSEGARRATGNKLLYTAADGNFVITGTPETPPRVVDDVQGTITGAALQFHAGDNSVMVLGNAKSGEGRRVHTETQVQQQ